MNSTESSSRALEEPPLWEAVKSTFRKAWKALPGLVGRGSPDDSPGARSGDLLRRLLILLVPYRRRLVIALSGVMISSGLGLGTQRMVKYLVEAVVPGGEPSDLGRVTLIMIALVVSRTLLDFLTNYHISVVGLRVVMSLRLALFEQLQRLSLTFYGQRRTGELVSRATNDVNAVHGTITGDLTGLVGHTFFFVGALGLLVYTEWRLALMLFALVPAVTLLSTLIGRIVREISVRISDQHAQMTTMLEESISGVRSVRSFVREDHLIERFRGQLDQLFGFILERLYLTALFSPLMALLFSSTSIALLWFGGKQVLAGRMSTGDLVMYSSLTMAVIGSIRWVAGLWTRLQEAAGASQRLFELLDTETDLAETPDAVPLAAVAGAVAFENVSFVYPPADPGSTMLSESAMPRVLDGISLTVRPGETVAVVGPSGAGKTTLCHLVPRFYDPTKGRVLVDGHDIRVVGIKSLRQQVGIVPQEPYLFGGTIRENILFGKLGATEEEMIEVARAANADEFIMRQSEGYDTVVGEQGLKLSGGQRQRLAIARALLKNPPILLLDEATSALDNESECLVQEAMTRLTTKRTTIVIAHRLSTVRNADRIAVIEQGRLVELGTHEQLMARQGLYAQLYLRQFRNEDRPDSANG